jgi:hypothetical protein
MTYLLFQYQYLKSKFVFYEKRILEIDRLLKKKKKKKHINVVLIEGW